LHGEQGLLSREITETFFGDYLSSNKKLPACRRTAEAYSTTHPERKAGRDESRPYAITSDHLSIRNAKAAEFPLSRE
jgi:hypothetical protein